MSQTVESRMGAVAWAIRQRSVSHPRSSNRTCPIKASGSPTGFTVRHTAGPLGVGVRDAADRVHRSREFIEFLKRLDAAYPAGTAIKLILDNHSAHISRETRGWLDAHTPGRFEFTFTPKHGSWPQSHRGLLLQIRAVGLAPHPGHLKTRTQTAHYRRHRSRKSPPRHPHLVIQTRRRRLI